MYLENLVIDAQDPQRLGRFWEAVLGAVRLTDEPDLYETRLTVKGGPSLDLCFPRVSDPPHGSPRLHLDLASGGRQTEEVERLLGLGARPLDISQDDIPLADIPLGDVGWVVLADPEGNPCCVLEENPVGSSGVGVDTGPLAAVPLDSSDPDRDAEFWSWLTGWIEATGSVFRSLRHPSMLGPFIELCPETARAPAAKNRLHFDIRLETGDDPDAVAAGIVERGGRELHPAWGELVWRVFADPSGNEFCVLPART